MNKERVSVNVGNVLAYEAACRIDSGSCASNAWANSDTRENSPDNVSVVRRMARPDL